MMVYKIPALCWVICGISFVLFIWGWFSIEKAFKQEMEKKEKLPYWYW